MGVTLSSPVEVIRVQRAGSESFKAAVAEMQGWRSSHEDAHEIACGPASGNFWVLDGHGGQFAATYGAPALVKEFSPTLSDDGGLPDDGVVEKGFASVDQLLRTEIGLDQEKESGSTVIGSLVAKQADGSYNVKLLNCGDSRGLVVRPPDETEDAAASVEVRYPQHLAHLTSEPSAIAKGNAPKAVQEWPLIADTIDHKPSHPTEQARIMSAGGTVSQEDPPRVDGNLAVSRGLGDFEYKSNKRLEISTQKVTCVPDVYSMSGLKHGTIIILGCDGVWDVMSSVEVGTFVRDRIREDPKADIGDLCQTVITDCLRRNSRDNITVMIVICGDGTAWASEADEVKCFENYANKYRRSKDPAAQPVAHEDGVESQDIDDEVFRNSEKFLKRSGFTAEPRPCDYCTKWRHGMAQCPCKAIYYCSKRCQKKGWKAHKTVCKFAASQTEEPAS